MRLLIVTNDYPPKPGGIQMYLQNLVDAYQDPVHVFAPADPDASRPEERVTRGSRSYMVPTKGTMEAVAETVGSFEPDAVLFGAPHPLPAMGPRLRERFNVPFGVLSHGAEITLPGAVPGLRRVLANNLAAADVRFAVSRFTAANVEKLSGQPATFLGAGVEVDTFTPPTEPTNNEIPIVGCVSRFVPRKGQERVIEAAALLERPVELLFVGKGRTEERLKARAEELGVTARFEVDVAWDELADLYRSMDVFVMPCKSRWGGLEVEGLGLVFLEAASTGLPVIAGDSGGSPETVVVGETGYVATEPESIAMSLSALLDDPERARAMGAAGRRFVMDEYTWPKVIERLYDGFAPHLR